MLAEGCRESNFLSDGRENLRKSNVLCLIIFSWPKEGHDVVSHVIKAFWIWSTFFCHKLASFACFSQQLFTLYRLWVIIIQFQSRSTQKLSQKFKICVNWPILQVKMEKKTYSWEFCKILFQLDCLFAEMNVQHLLIKENFAN